MSELNETVSGTQAVNEPQGQNVEKPVVETKVDQSEIDRAVSQAINSYAKNIEKKSAAERKRLLEEAGEYKGLYETEKLEKETILKELQDKERKMKIHESLKTNGLDEFGEFFDNYQDVDLATASAKRMQKLLQEKAQLLATQKLETGQPVKSVDNKLTATIDTSKVPGLDATPEERQAWIDAFKKTPTYSKR